MSKPTPKWIERLQVVGFFGVVIGVLSGVGVGLSALDNADTRDRQHDFSVRCDKLGGEPDFTDRPYICIKDEKIVYNK
jgi:hypothetical protein